MHKNKNRGREKRKKELDFIIYLVFGWETGDEIVYCVERSKKGRSREEFVVFRVVFGIFAVVIIYMEEVC